MVPTPRFMSTDERASLKQELMDMGYNEEEVASVIDEQDMQAQDRIDDLLRAEREAEELARDAQREYDCAITQPGGWLNPPGFGGVEFDPYH